MRYLTEAMDSLIVHRAAESSPHFAIVLAVAVVLTIAVALAVAVVLVLAVAVAVVSGVERGFSPASKPAAQRPPLCRRPERRRSRSG
jgi:hypothetical protein